MPASPSQVRADLTVVTAAAAADTRAVVQGAESPTEIRAALFTASPLIVADYVEGAAALALDWYEEIRDAASPPSLFTPSPLTLVSDDSVKTSVAVATRPLFDLEQLDRFTQDLIDQATRDSLDLLEPLLQKQVASGFWDTITGNVEDDPDAVGWQRFARPGACKFCLMCAARGAIYSESTANFSAHGGCHCVAGPAYDPGAPRASALQYVAAKKQRSEKKRAALREYLNHHYPDAPG